MYIFKTQSDGFRPIQKGLLFRDLPLLLLAVSLGMIGRAFEQPDSKTNWTVFAGIYSALMVIFILLFLRILSKKRQQYEDLVLSINEDGITREDYSSETLIIANEEVSKIYKTRDGGYVVCGAPGADNIIIPPRIEQAETLQRLLAGIKPFSEPPATEKYKYLAFAGGLCLCAAFVLTRDKWLVGISGVSLLVIYGYSFFKKYRYTNIAYISKWNIFFALYVVFIIVRRMYTIYVGE